MPEPIDLFFKVFNYNDGDRAILSNAQAGEILHNLERFGQDVGEDFENAVKNIGRKKSDIPNPVATIPPDYSLQQYLEPDKTTTLYNVTQDKHKKPLLEKVFSNMSYRVRNWDVEARSDLGNGNRITATLGEHAGLTYTKEEMYGETSLSAMHNLRNGKTELELHHENPTYCTSVSLFTRHDNVGGTISYYNKFSHLSSAFSVDKNSTSAHLSWRPKQNAEFGAYFNRDFHEKQNNIVGVRGRVTF